MGWKVVHLVAGHLDGGASRGAVWLHRGLRSLGVNSTVLAQYGDSSPEDGLETLSNNSWGSLVQKLYSRLDSLPKRLYPHRINTDFSAGLFSTDLRRHELVEQADIVHFHWINNGLVSTDRIVKFEGKKVVWTLRDMWAMTGGCHYALDCKGFCKNCGSCPILNSSREQDLSRFIHTKKSVQWKEFPIQLVGISNWLVSEASRSSLFQNKPVKMISNGVPMDDFNISNKLECKRRLKLPLDKPIIAMGAKNLHSRYKGFEYLLEALKGINDKVFLLLFGGLDESLMQKRGIEYLSLGSVSSNQVLRDVYNSADVFVAPSIAEAFGKTVVEAMACGCPVVAFDSTGPADIIVHRETGYLAKYKNSEDLRSGIEYLLSIEDQETLRSTCRNRAIQNFSIEVIAAQYKEVYEELLEMDS